MVIGLNLTVQLAALQYYLMLFRVSSDYIYLGGHTLMDGGLLCDTAGFKAAMVNTQFPYSLKICWCILPMIPAI